MIERIVLLAAMALLLPLNIASGQVLKPAPGKKTEKKKTRVVQWPRLSSNDKKTAARMLSKLVQPTGKKRPELFAKVRKRLLELGPGIMPQVMGRMKKSSDLKNQILRSLALDLAKKEYAAAVIPYLTNRLPFVRETAARILREKPNPTTMAKVEIAFEKEKDPKVKEMVAFTLCHLGNIKGLPLLYTATRKGFLERRAEILKAAQLVKCEASARWLDKQLAKDDKAHKLAILRLMTMAGDRKSATRAAALLENKDHTLVSAAINVLRVIIDGKKPLKHLSVFQMIEAKKKWQKRF